LNIKRDDFEHLRGQKIGVRESSKKYGISSKTVSRWAKAGYINKLDRGYRLYLDEADVAYCAAVYKAKFEYYEGQLAGVPIFDEEGNPYQVKYQEVAAQLRSDRRQKNEKRP
jgi:hypothetical protein